MHPRHAHRLGNLHAVIQCVHHHLQHGGDDGGTARRSRDQHQLAILRHDGWRHAAEHAFVGLYFVGDATDQSIGITRVGFRGEIIHFIVQQHTGARGNDFAAVGQIQCCCVRHGITCGIDEGCVRGVVAFFGPMPCANRIAGRGFVRIEVCKALLGVGLVRQLRDGHFEEIRIAQMLRPIGIGAPLRFNHQMHGIGRAKAHAFDVVVLQHVQHLHQQYPPRGRRWHGDDVVAAIGAMNRVAKLRPITLEVFAAYQTVAAHHLSDDGIRHRAFIKTSTTLF